MKLIELHIYGYGKLEDYVIKSLDQFEVFYGENEAGKSTIMSFIHSILFGFPTRQSSEIRYEPKNNPKYGGKIKAFFPDRGVAVIERVKGKAAGDVTVSLEDGTIGGEELLKDLLKRMDKSIFQAIFSFNVHGLQNIHALKGEDLGRYLFSAGTIGTDKLFNTESYLLKEMEQRFKPGGRRPLLNEKMKELKEVQASLKNAEQQNDQYSKLVEEKGDMENEIAWLEGEIGRLEQIGVKLREYKRNEKLVIEAAALQRKIQALDQSFFPEDGLARLERLDEQLKQIQARILTLKEKQQHDQGDLDKNKPDKELLGMETEIEARIENLPLYDQLKQEKRLLESKFEEINEEISMINDQLHADFDEENIQEINTSIFTKDEAEKLQQAQQRSSDKKLQLEEDFEEEKRALAELEEHADSVKRQWLDEDRRKQLMKELDQLENRERIQAEWQHVSDQIEEVKAREATEKTRNKKLQKKARQQSLLLGGIFLIVLIWGAANGTWLLAGVGLAGLIFLAVGLLKSADDTDAGHSADAVILSKLIERERSLKEILNIQPGGNLFSIKSLLTKDEEARLLHRELQVKIGQQQQRFEKVVQQFEVWEADNVSLKQKKGQLLKQLGLAQIDGPIKLLDAYHLLEKQKQYYRDRKRTTESLKKVTGSLKDMEDSLKMLAGRFLQNGNLPPVEAAGFLKRALREAMEQQTKQRELEAKLNELGEELAALLKEELVLREEKAGLLAQADTDLEEVFRLKAKNAELLKGWAARLEDIDHQLIASGISEEDRERILTGISLEEQIEENTAKLEACKRDLTQQFDSIADVKHKMKIIEDGGIYSELLHKYRQLQHEFAEDAKEWGKYAVARDLLSKTIGRYKEDRMPRMLAKAERFLSVLTDGFYGKIIPQPSGSGFLIERKDHVLFEANELSQATAEQVYVSIRLALAAVHHDRYPFPIIIDDSFVNFDHNRTGRVIQLLREMSGQNQILIFTCHRHLLDYFSDNEIVHMGETSKNPV
ncbi:AAA family ATPase [Bacillus sp. ISL-35]|uniref:ATP-binding protein n=1 Tax=Bacillus sp. ISL-35 TaxID=2819122 RepID=UPI001BE85698|nr:AAA family ATPase [Bacillus sp. ISL-35]MBT2678072.1 AAA family ATPase [Bacillus sp. ISL-35]MBT2705713.1 AAA family ATPase [Chryseobacterium sp. ISL-80]